MEHSGGYGSEVESVVLLPDVESMFWVIAGEAEEVGVSVCNDHIDFFAKFSDWDESCEYVKLV